MTERLGSMSGPLQCAGMPIRGVVFDLDGTLFVSFRPREGAVEVVSELRRRGLRLAFLTNNSTYSVRNLHRALNGMGIVAAMDEVLTSSYVTARWLLETRGEVGVLPIGEAGLVEELVRAGHRVVGEEEAEAVVVGLDRELTYSKLMRACRAIWRGALFVATNRDRYLPTEHGPVPGAGAVVAAIEAVTGRNPIVVGKPEPLMLDRALRRMGLDRSEVVVVGDNPETDAEMALRAGVPSVIVWRDPDPRWEARGVRYSRDLRAALKLILEGNVDE